jgi:hypothetical protein
MVLEAKNKHANVFSIDVRLWVYQLMRSMVIVPKPVLMSSIIFDFDDDKEGQYYRSTLVSCSYS